MARRVTAWACEFGCRRKVDTSRTRMISHEARCAWNPARRACPTCRHDAVETMDNGIIAFLQWDERFCDIDKRPAPGPDDDKIVNIIYNCSHWEQKEGY